MWDYSEVGEPFPYGEETTYRLAGRFLSGPDLVEDWGCGTGYARNFIHAPYRGIDGAWSKWATRQVDLMTYRSDVPRILMRHVLEHNLGWRTILANMLASFTDRACLITFTPFAERDDVHLEPPGWPIPDLSLSGPDFARLLEADGSLEVEAQHLVTATQYSHETVLFLTRHSGGDPQ